MNAPAKILSEASVAHVIEVLEIRYGGADGEAG